MAREILFKANSIDNGEWVEGSYVYRPKEVGDYRVSHYILVHDDYGFNWREIDIDTLCQYTGLTDNNGNKIWENDIVEIPTEDEYFHLKWEEDTARFVMSSNSFIVTFDNYWSHEVEVIGNIFDNQELLEGE